MMQTITVRQRRKPLRLGSVSFNLVNYALLVLFAVMVFYPFYFCVMLSFNDGKDAKSGGIYLWPRVFSLENYKMVFSEPMLLTASRNSVLRTVFGTLLTVYITAMFAYAVSRRYLLFKKFYLTLGFITLYFNGGLIPTFLLVRNLGLLDSFLVYLIPAMFQMYYAIIIMSFFKTIPESMVDAAKIDGANDFYIFIRVILPVSTPVIAAIALFAGVGQWNSWFDTMLYTRSKSLDTLSHVLMKMIQTQRYFEQAAESAPGGSHILMQMRGMTSTSLQLATMVVAAFPIVVVYPFLQKYFTKGIMIGSIKG